MSGGGARKVMMNMVAGGWVAEVMVQRHLTNHLVSVFPIKGLGGIAKESTNLVCSSF